MVATLGVFFLVSIPLAPKANWGMPVWLAALALGAPFFLVAWLILRGSFVVGERGFRKSGMGLNLQVPWSAVGAVETVPYWPNGRLGIAIVVTVRRGRFGHTWWNIVDVAMKVVQLLFHRSAPPGWKKVKVADELLGYDRAGSREIADLMNRRLESFRTAYSAAGTSVPRLDSAGFRVDPLLSSDDR
jgi:hypothetical protein